MAHNSTPEGRALQAKSQIPFLQGLPETVRAIKALTGYSERLRRGVPPMPRATGSAAALDGDGLHRLLGEYGLTPPSSDFGETSEDAASAAERVGFPVALKIVSPQASHKTEVGGVALNLRDEIEVHAEAEAMAARLRHADPDAEISGFLVQEMVDGVEFILGVRRDPQFGPFMVAGLGGVLVEAVKDVSFRLLPVTEWDARDMLGELKAKALLGAFRGRPARDVDALVAAMCGLSALYADHRNHMTDMEINPLIVLEEGAGVRAVDVRIVG
jgi:acetyltransferase